jgi:cytochrome P450
MIRAWLGLPEDDHEQLLEWFDEMNRRIPGKLELPPSALVARDSMRAYIQTAAERRRRREQADLLTPLVRAHAAGDITMDELLALTMLLFFAGIITTAGLLSTSLRLLAERPNDRLLLREESARIPDAVEEFLRFDSPLQFLARTSIRDVEIHGQKIPAGAKVVLLWGAANRDERRWEHPDKLDLTREPQRHLAFGVGIHHCLGAPLARLEGSIALEEILRVVGDWKISGPVERLYSPNERVLLHLPVRIPVLAT